MEDLKPCPFCGSDRITVWNIRDGQQAVCKDCNATGAPLFHGPGRASDPLDTWRKAIAAWNTRTDISNALIAAAYEAAADKCFNPEWSVKTSTDHIQARTSGLIRDLTPDDARAAYDAAIRAAKIEGMREAGKAIEDAGYYCIPPYEGTGNLDQQITYSNDAITALIEETEKGGNKHGPLRTAKNVPV